MDQYFLIAAIIALLAIVQSIFGIGLLVFGTPTLLLLGLDFSEALGWLLPASIVISTIQTLADPSRACSIWRGGHLLLCLIPLVASLALVLWLDLQARLDVVIGLTLIAASAIRYNSNLQRHISRFIAFGERIYLVVMGAMHGFTNMGGALLTVYATSQHREKHDIRGTIATYYLMFAGAQIATLAVMKPSVLGWQSLAAVAIAALGYSICGHLVFRKATQRVYDGAVTCFIAAYGAAVLLKSML
jgi:uncharacterized membrane protein YfcA